jgi:cytochrome c1
MVHSSHPVATAERSAVTPLWRYVELVQQWWTQVVTNASRARQMTKQDKLALVGHDLFWAKGCTACHLHSAVPVDWSTQAGPDLSHYDKTAAFLRLLLADPAAIKPTTEMPNLGLNSAEIEALAAFLVQDGPAAKP